ncbi:CHAT domain-containing protein [Streptomyces sp. NPDC057403]|uniref:CHAT domain-containing protein n=1 Tax=Streptomyces sp. NPDC057403 TaxID=3346119 RepID=UPI0036BEE466
MIAEEAEEVVNFLMAHSTNFDTLSVNLKLIFEKDRRAIQRALQQRAEAAAGAGRLAEAELLALLIGQVRQEWGPLRHDVDRPAFAALLDRVVRLDGLLDAFLAFRSERDVLPADPVTVAQNLLGSYTGITGHQVSAVIAALAMAAPDTPLSAVIARTWWASGLMERARRYEALGRADVVAKRDRRHALFHAGRAVVELHASGHPEQDLEVAYWAYSMLAQAHRSLGDLRKGLGVLLDCQRRLRHLDGDRERWLEFDRVVAIELSAQGHHRAALAYFDQALRTFHDLAGDRLHMAEVDLLIERGKSHLRNGALAAATADFRQAAETADALNEASIALRARALWASSLESRGRSREALRIFEENLAMALRGGIFRSHSFRCALAQQLRTMGYLDEAEEQYRLALAEMRQGTHTRNANEIGCLAGLGDVAEARGDHDQAMNWHQESYRASFDYRRPIEGTVTLAAALMSRIQRDRSRSMAQELLPQFTRLRQDALELGEPVGEFAAGRALMLCLSRLDRWAEAADLGRQLIAQADRRADRSNDVQQDLDGFEERRTFVRAFRDQPGLLGECFRYAQWCRDAARRRIDHTPWPVLRAEVGGLALGAYESLLALYHDHGGELPLLDERPVAGQCFDLHEEVKARDLLTDLSLGPLPPPPGVPDQQLAEEQELLTALRHELSQLPMGPASDESADKLTTRLSAVHTAIGAHAPEYARLRQGAPARLTESRALVEQHAPAEGMLLVSYFCGKRNTYCFVLTSDHEPLRMHRVPLGRDRIQAVSRHLRTVFNGGPDPSGVVLRPLPARRPDKRDTGFLAELSPLLEPCADLLAERRLVAVSAHGPLAGIPFAALPLPSGRSLGETNAVVNIPGVSSLRYLMARPTVPPRTVVAAGCAGREDDPALFEHDDALLGDGPWRSVSRVTGLDATPTTVRNALARAELAHVTAHGYADSGDPLDTALLFSDGVTRPSRNWEPHNLPAHARHLLRARDITVADAAPYRLVLRACSAGWGEADHPGADLTGLTWAFLRSGSRSIIAPRWNVNQESSRELLASFYRRLGSGEPAWRALWEAQRQLAQDVSRPWLSHFFHWGAFTLTGDWR